MILRHLALTAVTVIAMIGSQTAFAETPTPISILIEEKITVGDGSTPSGEVIDEPISVTDEVTTSGEVIEEPIGVTDEVTTSGEVIEESISVTDTVETQLSASPTPTATAVPKKIKKRPTAVPAKRNPKGESKASEDKKPSRKSTVTPTPTPVKKDSKSPFARGTGSVNEEPDDTNGGSCNSPSGYEGLALMSALLIPGVLRYRRRKK